MLKTINGIDLLLLLLAVGFFIAWRIEKADFRDAKMRMASGQCWLSTCVLDAGHRGMHRD